MQDKQGCSNSIFFERTPEQHGVESIVQLIPLMTHDYDKYYRAAAKIKILLNLRRLGEEDRGKAVSELFRLLECSDDDCQRNYITDILLSLADHEVDGKLLLIANNPHGRFPDFLKTYIKGLLVNRKYQYERT